jgi:hypothetical protein
MYNFTVMFDYAFQYIGHKCHTKLKFIWDKSVTATSTRYLLKDVPDLRDNFYTTDMPLGYMIMKIKTKVEKDKR